MTRPYPGEETFQKSEYDHATAKAHAMFVGWVENIGPVLAEHEVLNVELEFTFPLLNPETESPSKTFVEAGKIDGVLRHRASGAIKVLEHKTTSESVEPASDYWARLAMDGQISKYVLAVMQGGQDVRSVVYDVAKKPAIRTLRAGKDNPETPEEFFERNLANVRENPADFYVQREIPRSDSDLVDYCKDAWELSKQILYSRQHNLWPRNPNACTAYGQCEYFDLCAGRATVDGIRYDLKPVKHAELFISEQGGKEFLTNSRLTALRKCPRFHALKYETPTEKIGETSEALRLGSSFHAGCEAYLKTLIGK